LDRDDSLLSEGYRRVLRTYLDDPTPDYVPSEAWRKAIREAITFLGGQAEQHTSSLGEYDHGRYGPYLGVSDEGSAAPAVRKAAFTTPKAKALGLKTSPLTLGLGLDAERLGSIGEVPVGPDEYSHIWTECAGRIPMTTNVGSRANVRFYKRSPIVIIASKEGTNILDAAKSDLDKAFEPFAKAPGEPRPVVVSVQFDAGVSPDEQRSVLQALAEHVKADGVVNPKIHQLGLNVRIQSGTQGKEEALRGIDLAKAVGLTRVSLEGIVRNEGDQLVSLPGLLNYLEPDLLAEVLKSAGAKGIAVTPVNVVDPETVAREIWTGLSAARAMGLDLGKYGLAPLTLEECDRVVKQVQQWFPGWTAAPVFYADQGILSNNKIYTGKDLAAGIEAWLKIVAKHGVQVVLIDTVEKSKSWKILKTNDDPKGLLLPDEVKKLKMIADKLGIKTLWAGGITMEHAYLMGKLGVFGVYVTSAASKAAPVSCAYDLDPALASEKEPTYEGVLEFKTILEAGYLVERTNEELRKGIAAAGMNINQLSPLLQQAWKAWWKSGGNKPAKDSKKQKAHK
jgi:hypothetical protein